MSHEIQEPAAQPSGDRSRFGDLHTRTYEMELLVSGAVVFGLLQLPRILYPVFDRFDASLAGDVRLLGAFAESYVMMMLWVLIVTFTLHLILRAYWIGLLGLESVFEHGIKWEEVRQDTGPNWFRILKQKLGSLAEAIDRTDDRCSLLFSCGFLLVLVFVFSVFLVGVSLVVALALSHLIFGAENVTTVFWSVLAFLLLLQPVAGVLDKRLGPKLRPDGLPARLLARLVRFAFTFSPTRAIGVIVFTLSSNLSPAKVSAAIIIACSVLGVVQIGSTLTHNDLVRFGSQSFFPVTLRTSGIDPAHYRDRRAETGIKAGVPSVQSVLIQEPYLQLMVSYSPRRHNELIRSRCPQLQALRNDGFSFGRGGNEDPASVRAAAACLGSLFEVRLDGALLAEPRWDFTVEPDTRLAAVLTFVSLDGLSPGRHELEVTVPGRHASPDHPNPERHLIPFWR